MIELIKVRAGQSMMPALTIFEWPRATVLWVFLIAFVFPFSIVCLGLLIGVVNSVLWNITTNEHFNYKKYGAL